MTEGNRRGTGSEGYKILIINILPSSLTLSLILEKGNCGVVIPLYNFFREEDRGGELREKNIYKTLVELLYTIVSLQT